MGKKSGPKAPPAPDPVKTAAAQAQANREAAIAQANLNRIDQYTPQGNITYQQIGTNADGTPQYKQTQQYSPEQQRLYEQEVAADSQLNALALNNMQRVADTQSKPFSYDGMAPVVTGVRNVPGVRYFGGDVGRVQSSLPNAGEIARSISDAGGVQRGIAGAGAVGRDIAGAGAVGRDIADAGGIERLSGAGAGVRNEFGGAGEVQRGLSFDGLGGLPGTSDFGADAQRVSDAVYGQAKSRLDPQFQQAENDMRSRLINSGIAENSQAFQREMDNFTRQRADAYNQANFSAIQAGGSEQSRLFGLALGARQQGVSERAQQGQFANQAQQQQYAQSLGRGEFANNAQQQQYAQIAAQMQANNAAQQQQYAQNAGRAEFANQAQQQQYAQNAGRAEFANQAQAQEFGQNTAQAQFGNQAQAQAFQQNAAQAQFGNDAQEQRYAQNLGSAEFANNAQNQMFGQDQQRQAAYNTAQNQAFNQNLTNANLQNAARQQQIQEATYLRNLPINEIAALLGTGGTVQNPQFSNISQVGVAAPDYQGAVYNNYNAAMQQYQAKMANRSAGLGSIFGAAGSLGSAAILASDRRVKHNIRRIGELANGLVTYVFSYIGDTARHFGVMAQEVLDVRPEAVIVLPSGYMAVDYRKVW